MGLTIKTDENGVIIYRKDRTTSNGKNYSTYFLKVSSKDRNGEWHNAFVDVLFKSGVSVENKTKIFIKNAFYIVDEYNGNTKLKLMITDFDSEGSNSEHSNSETPGWLSVSDEEIDMVFN